MINIEDLEDIPKASMEEINKNLEELLTNKIITGYNWYTKLPKDESRICVTHMHDSEEYKQAMISDLEKKLGYDSKEIERQIRERGTAYYPWDLTWQIHKGLKLINIKTGKHLDSDLIGKLSKYVNLQRFQNLKDSLKAEDPIGWELNIPFGNMDELNSLLELFLHQYNPREVNHWPKAYKTPVLLIGEEALSYQSKLPEFASATKIGLIQGNNEISFIINKKLEKLKKLKHYQILRDFGFIEEQCLGNDTFIDEYVDYDEINNTN